MVRVIARRLVSEGIQARESRCKNHTRIVAQRVGQNPAVRQLGASGGCLITQNQRDAGVAQCVEPHGDRQLSNPVEGSLAIRGNAEFAFQIECATAACQLDNVRYISLWSRIFRRCRFSPGV